ncbi:MAG: peptide chain release factor N(5)-glutamine methyltransferase [Rubrivivax sp.]
MSATVGAALAQARALGLDRLDAQLLLAYTLQRPRAWLIAHDEAELSPPQQARFEADCRRRADAEPLAYLLGEREFHGLVLRVTPDVLVPRPDTETLVDWALELLAGPLAAPATLPVVDLGTGSGAIALALKHRHPRATVCAVDISEPAITVARANAMAHRLEIEFLTGHWWQPLQGRRFGLVLSNPPYVAFDDPHLDALRHEPLQALSPGGNGLSAIEHILHDAPQHLLPGGWLLLEHGHEQAEHVRHCLGNAGFGAVQTRADLAGRPRCTGGRLGPD